MSDLSLVVPAYNEAARLPHRLRALREFVGGRPRRVDVVVVDDGSADGTGAVAAAVRDAPRMLWDLVKINRRLANGFCDRPRRARRQPGVASHRQAMAMSSSRHCSRAPGGNWACGEAAAASPRTKT